MKRFYIAYGSNLNVRQMRMRCPDAVISGTAFIPDYRLLFKGNGYSGAVYKSFTNEEEAKAFIKKEERKVSDDLTLLAYVDA